MISYDIIFFFFGYHENIVFNLSQLLLFEVISKTTEQTIFFLPILHEYNRLISILIIQKFEVYKSGLIDL